MCSEKDDTTSLITEAASHKVYQLFMCVMVLDLDEIGRNKVTWKFWNLFYSARRNLKRKSEA